jgi:hypothetical protein
VQARPFSANDDGAEKLPPCVPWKPNDAVPPGGIEEFQAMLRAVIAPLEPVSAVFQELVTDWPLGSVKVSAHPFTGLLPVLATVTFATKPVFHESVA